MNFNYYTNHTGNKLLGSGCLILLFSLLIISCNSNQARKTKLKTIQKDLSGPLFKKLSPAQTGVDFSNTIPLEVEAEQFDYSYMANGAGVAIADLNNDGLEDIYFTSNLGPNKLYINKGNLQFEEIAESAGVDCNDGGWNTGVTCADVNGDGWIDLYVSRSGDRTPDQKANLLFINKKDGTFSEEGAKYGLNDKGCATQAAFFDFDLDGDLDVYVMNHPNDWNRRSVSTCDPMKADKRHINSDRLYRNDNGKFIDVSQEIGLRPDGLGFGLGLSVGYLNNDKYPDIFVGNDYFGRDFLYYFDSKLRKYKEVGENKMKHMSNSSMGTDASDLDNDGDSDILVMEMNAEDNFRQKTLMPSMDIEKFWATLGAGQHYQYMYNMLHANAGNGFYSEVGQMAGISNTDWSWSVLAADYDLDGLKDIYITNGYPRDVNDKDVRFLKGVDELGNEVKVTSNKDRLPLYQVTPLPNYSFKNQGELSFEKTSNLWGLADLSISMGAAYADLDNDGDLELVVNNYNDTAFIYKNQAIENGLGKGLKISLKGPSKNPHGIGSRIQVFSSGMTQSYDNFPTRGYSSSVPSKAYFGFAAGATIDSIKVKWPDGRVNFVLGNIDSKQIEISWSDSEPDKRRKPRTRALFTDATKNKLTPIFNHQENEYHDFDNEVLLPHSMSRFGPSIAVGDLNNDGKHDAVVGGSAGQTAAIYMQTSFGAMQGRLEDAITKDAGHEDVAAAIFDFDGDGDNDIYMGSGGNEYEQGSIFYQDRLYRNDNGKFVRDLAAIPDLRLATKTVAPFDFDSDGDIDLFVGAGHLPREYGKDAQSVLLRNDGGKLVDVTGELAPELLNIGMINQAVWANIDEKNGSELVLAGDWMPITVLSWNGSEFSNVTKSSGLDQQIGWFSAIAAHDMDNDGDTDLLAGNLGLNYKYKATSSEPFRLFAGDYDNSGTWDIALGYYYQGECYPVRGKQCSSEQIPSIKKKFPTYREFGESTIYDVYGEEKLNNGISKEANEFASVYLENDGSGKFSFKRLPRLAQVSSINGFVIDDLNKDGNPDVVLAGNLFSSEIETPRNDASNGLVLLGDGNGNFNTMEFEESGFFAPGDVKNIKPIKINNSLGILVANNHRAVQLFQKK